MQRILFAVASIGIAILNSPAEDKPAAAAMSDEEFVIKAASGGMFEVESSKIAQDSAKSNEVKQFAQQMITDHTKANQKLKDIAKKANLGVPTKMTDQHQQMIQKIKSAEGNQFDPVYLDAQLKAHQQTVDLFENASKTLKNPDLKAFAEKTLPTLKDHLSHVKDIAKPQK